MDVSEWSDEWENGRTRESCGSGLWRVGVEWRQSEWKQLLFQWTTIGETRHWLWLLLQNTSGHETGCHRKCLSFIIEHSSTIETIGGKETRRAFQEGEGTSVVYLGKVLAGVICALTFGWECCPWMWCEGHPLSNRVITQPSTLEPHLQTLYSPPTITTTTYSYSSTSTYNIWSQFHTWLPGCTYPT